MSAFTTHNSSYSIYGKFEVNLQVTDWDILTPVFVNTALSSIDSIFLDLESSYYQLWENRDLRVEDKFFVFSSYGLARYVLIYFPNSTKTRLAKI